MAAEAGDEFTVCLVEKGSEIGAHILSGAVVEPRALDELFPDWKQMGAPLDNPVTEDDVYYLIDDYQGMKLPSWLVPTALHNEGNHAVSLGNLCRWLGEQAEELGVNIFPGFAASEILYNEDGSIKGIATGDMGVSADGEHKSTYTPGYELYAKYTVFAEGARGHLGKQLM
jgi:electron-transferring-flavoprotein dehydrogenase